MSLENPWRRLSKLFGYNRTNDPESSDLLSVRELTGAIAATVCGCGSCRVNAEPALRNNPALKRLNSHTASKLWGTLRSQSRESARHFQGENTTHLLGTGVEVTHGLFDISIKARKSQL